MANVSFIPIEVSRQMRSREKPLWIGKPIPRKFALKEGWSALLNGIVLIAVAVYWEIGAIQSGNMVSVLIGVPFVAIGLESADHEFGPARDLMSRVDGSHPPASVVPGP